uniref:Uncharacterized protein n=1 Tax=Panagrolaimus sp. JU765 TaxID=591449 RepID=A0AC34QIN9_9BILA
MKTYVALCLTVEVKVAARLIETVANLVNRLLFEEHLHCSLLAVGEKTELVCDFTERVELADIKEIIERLSFVGLSDLSSLVEYFGPENYAVEDGYCFILCDRFQQVPPILTLRVDQAFGVFLDLQASPLFYRTASWDPYVDEEPSSFNSFVDDACKAIKSVSELVFELPNARCFKAHPFPRLPQKVIFDDPEFTYPPEYRPGIKMTDNASLLELIGFLPEATTNALIGRGCTYFLKPGSLTSDEKSYFVLSKFIATSHKIMLFRRSIGDYFILRTYRPNIECQEHYLMLEYTTSTTVKFCRFDDEKPKLKFRKHLFSYDSHTSFENKECMESILNRINRILKSESSEEKIKKLLMATRQMAVSCQSIFASGFLTIIQNHIPTASPDMLKFYKTLEKILMSQTGGLKEVVKFLETLVPNSRIKVELY